MFFGHSLQYDLENIRRIHIKNNHIHHAGYGLRDDVEACFFGFFHKGVEIEHNSIHDIISAHYSGNGIAPDTGSSGSLVTNNLIYNISNGAFGMNFGREHVIKNNIFAYCGTGIGFASCRDGELVMTATNNIIYQVQNDSLATQGPFTNKALRNDFNFNIY